MKRKKINKKTQQELDEKFIEIQRQVFNNILRPVPWWMPRFIHRLLARLFFKS